MIWISAILLFLLGAFTYLLFTWLKGRNENKKLLTELSESKARYSLLSDNLAAAVILRDVAGKIIFCSPYTEVLSGYARSEIEKFEGDFFASIVHDKDREQYLRAIRVSEVGEPFQFRYRFFHRSGMEIWAETRTVPLADTLGKVTAALSITIDVTGTVLYQKQVEEKNRDLQDFTYMITHDLKSSIFTIKGMAGVLLEDFADKLPKEAVEIAEHISRASLRLEELVGGVLEYSKISSEGSATESTTLAEVLKDVAADVQTELKACGGELNIEPSLPAVMGDRMKLYRIFVNLVGNAIKYREKSRILKIEVKKLDISTPRAIIISVSDNGLGIPKDKLPTIFRPFQRAHRGLGIEGTGIGLASVKKLVEKLGGDIEVQSEEGKGSNFIVTLLTPRPT